MKIAWCLKACLLAIGIVTLCYGEWTRPPSRLQSRWAQEVTADKLPLPGYPRPQMVRTDWQNLNGLWKCTIQSAKMDNPPGIEEFDRDILVPYPVESVLSGIKERLDNDQALFCRRDFTLPDSWKGRRILLHFGAVDWESTVWINGKQVTTHKGGYVPFSIDVTEHLRRGQENELVVRAWDPTDGHWQPRGKQVRNPKGIWYTPVSGIWQTVWLEPVPEAYFKNVSITPHYDQSCVDVLADLDSTDGMISVEILSSGQRVTTANGKVGEVIRIALPGFKSWSPDSPHLYDVRVSLEEGGRTIDQVRSYFGMRKIELKADPSGIQRMYLNDEPTFQFGVLDQGWWPTGLYTAPTDEALRYDIEIVKKCGFNMIRKHVKVEPARWYYWCDKLGILVWQDMPNGDKHIAGHEPDLQRSPASQRNFDREWQAVIDATRHHPSIVVWVPFNEGWGQSDTTRVIKWTQEYDPTRLVDGPSGWADRQVGDLHDKHQYPGPSMYETEEKRASVLGEFGGLGLPVEGHLWQIENNWGYRTHRTTEQLQSNYRRLISNLRPLIKRGLAAAVYTQITDVESEVNGLMTYDRDVLKLDADWLARIHAGLYGPPPKLETVTATSANKGQKWRYRLEEPTGDWTSPDYDDSSWEVGEGGFGTVKTPGAVVRTEWNTSDIWLRRTVPAISIFDDLNLVIHHDEDAEVYLNGIQVSQLNEYTTDYEFIPLEAEKLRMLRESDNSQMVLAIHCRQTQGGQYIDVGLSRVIEAQPNDESSKK